VVGAAVAVLVAVVTLTAATGLLAAANRRERAERDKANADFRLAVQAVPLVVEGRVAAVELVLGRDVAEGAVQGRGVVVLHEVGNEAAGVVL
jgi:hypothetical protein